MNPLSSWTGWNGKQGTITIWLTVVKNNKWLILTLKSLDLTPSLIGNVEDRATCLNGIFLWIKRQMHEK